MQNDIEKRIRLIIGNYADISVPIDKIGPDDNLIDIGLNSLSYIKLIVLLEKEFDIEFNEYELNIDNYKSINAVVKTVEGYLQKK
jgi:acyl carrier protein